MTNVYFDIEREKLFTEEELPTDATAVLIPSNLVGKTLWVEIETGRICSRKERNEILVDKYSFDDWTPISEIYEYFAKVEWDERFTVENEELIPF